MTSSQRISTTRVGDVQGDQIIASILPPMHRMPQERIRGAQQYCHLGKSGVLGDLVAQPGEEAAGPASSSFVGRMREAELLEWEAAELRAAAARKDAEAASKQLVALDSFHVALSGTPAHQLRGLICVWKDAWRVGPHPSVASGAASTAMMSARTAPVPSIVPAPIITMTAPNISGTIVSIPDTRLSDSLGDLSDVNWAGIEETIAQSRITDSPAATPTISALAAPMDIDDAIGQSASMTTTSTEDEDNAADADISRPSTPGEDIITDLTLDADADLLNQILGVCATPPRDVTGTTTMIASTATTDDAVVLTPVVTQPGDVTITVDTSVLSGGIADQLVQALVSSGDIVVPSLPMAAVPAAVAIPGKGHHYACSVEGCGMRANSRNTILRHLHTLHWNTHFQCVAGKKLKGDTPDAMGKHIKTCKYRQQNVKTPCKPLFMQHQLEQDNHNVVPACIP